MRITVFGTGYVGLVTGTCLADAGHDVLCVDVDPAKVEALNQGQVPIHEPGLAPMVARNRQLARIQAHVMDNQEMRGKLLGAGASAGTQRGSVAAHEQEDSPLISP